MRNLHLIDVQSCRLMCLLLLHLLSLLICLHGSRFISTNLSLLHDNRPACNDYVTTIIIRRLFATQNTRRGCASRSRDQGSGPMGSQARAYARSHASAYEDDRGWLYRRARTRSREGGSDGGMCCFRTAPLYLLGLH